MDFTHLGWIPCLNGHLDFGLMKPGISGGFTKYDAEDQNTARINFSYNGPPDSHARKILLQSRVDWSDSAPTYDYDGDFRVSVIAKVSKSNHLDKRYLSGSVFIYLISDFNTCSSGYVDQELMKLMQGADAHLKDWKTNKSNFNWEKYQEDLTLYYSKAKRVLCGYAEKYKNFWRIDFKAEPDGLLYIDNRQITRDKYCESESYIIARQAYYYIKYSLHNHKHHDYQADSLTTLVKLHSKNPQELEAAALSIVGQLKRELTHIKRTMPDGASPDISAALGIIGYMKSLITTLSYREYLQPNIKQRELAYLEGQEQSFLAKNNKVNAQFMLEKTARDEFNAIVGWLLIVLGVLVSVATFVAPILFMEESIKQFLMPATFDSFISTTVIGLASVYLVIKSLKKRFITLHLTDGGFNKFVRHKYHKSFWQMLRANIKELFSVRKRGLH